MAEAKKRERPDTFTGYNIGNDLPTNKTIADPVYEDPEQFKNPVGGINQSLKDTIDDTREHEHLLDKRAKKAAEVHFDVLEAFYSFNAYFAYKHLSKTRAKPWDNRELDALEGIKYLMFIFATMAQTGYTIFHSFIINLLGLFNLFYTEIATLGVSFIFACNLAMEMFLLMSVFTVTYRCF